MHQRAALRSRVTGEFCVAERDLTDPRSVAFSEVIVMRSLKYALPLVLFVLLAASARAEEGEKHEKKAHETWTGTLDEAPKDAKAGVVAVLKVKKDDKEIAVNLWAEGKN